MMINGNIDLCGEGLLQGWVVCRDAPGTRLDLEVLCGEDVIGQCRADLYREDLELAGLGDGHHGFSFDLPLELEPAALRSIRIRLAGSDLFLLQRGPQPADDELLPVFQHLSRFGGLWIDRLDWVDRLGQLCRSGALSDEMSLRIMSFVRDGFVVLRGAVDALQVDALNQGIARLWEAPLPGMAMRIGVTDGHDVTEPAGAWGRDGGAELLDLHDAMPALHAALAAPATLAFLQAIFADAPALRASATQHCNGARPFVQDSVTLGRPENPLALAGVWLALDDTRPGDGSPMLLAGSHRARDFLFGGTGKLLRDGPAEFAEYTVWMQRAALAGDYLGETPVLRAGDVVIRHADLLHAATAGEAGVMARGVLSRFVPARFVPAHLAPTTNM